MHAERVLAARAGLILAFDDDTIWCMATTTRHVSDDFSFAGHAADTFDFCRRLKFLAWSSPFSKARLRMRANAALARAWWHIYYATLRFYLYNRVGLFSMPGFFPREQVRALSWFRHHHITKIWYFRVHFCRCMASRDAAMPILLPMDWPLQSLPSNMISRVRFHGAYFCSLAKRPTLNCTRDKLADISSASG